MKYYKFEKEKDFTLKQWLFHYLDDKDVQSDCIITFGLGIKGDTKVEKDMITFFGNVYVKYIGQNEWKENVYECVDFEGDNEVLYVYGYTPIEEVIMTRGVV